MLTQPYITPLADLQSSKSPGTVEDKEGVGTQTWEKAGEAKASDNLYAECALERGRESHYLKATNFAFALPETATVVGVLVSIERSASKKSSNFSIRDRHVRIVKGGVVQEGVDKAMPVQWPTADAVETYGASNDAWGQDWTPSDINNAGFGVALAAVGEADTTATAKVDSITITVYYTEAEDDDRLCFAGRSMELRSNGIFRQHATDDVWGGLVPQGFYPTVPPGGLEEKPTRTIIIPSTGDLAELPDSTIAPSLTATTHSRDGYHFAREAKSSE